MSGKGALFLEAMNGGGGRLTTENAQQQKHPTTVPGVDFHLRFSTCSPSPQSAALFFVGGRRVPDGRKRANQKTVAKGPTIHQIDS